MRQLTYTIDARHDGMTMECFLKQEHQFSASLVRSLKLHDGMHRNGAPIRSIAPLVTGDLIVITLHDCCKLQPNPALQVEVVYADDDLIVYNKPPFMPVHPSLRHYDDTLGNHFTAHFTGGFHPINRLDRNTTGLCLIARHPYATARLSRQVQKQYTALVCGILPDEHGTIDAPIARAGESIIRRMVSPDGQHAVTHYRVTGRFARHTQVDVTLETGRTHQIRVHFAHLGYPLAGDDMYGGDCTDFAHHMLCCTALDFVHPVTNQPMQFQIPMSSGQSPV